MGPRISTTLETGGAIVARMAISSCVKSMTTDSEALVKVAPTWGHLEDGNKFNMKAADKHLVRWPSKAKLTEGVVRLVKAMKHAGLL